MSEELKPCPFCGAAGTMIWSSKFHWVECVEESCGAEAGAHESLDVATRKWNRRAAPAAQPPAIGGEPEVVCYQFRHSEQENWYFTHLATGFWEHRALILQADHCAHVARLQAEVERVTAYVAKLEKSNEEYSGAAVDSGMECDRLTARYAELEGLLDRIRRSVREQHCDDNDAEFDLPVPIMAEIDAALNKTEGQCCTPTADERAILAAGDHTPEELWGGPRPTCPKCIKTEGQQS